ncbi:hypothetical protein [Mucilaginibacter sp. UR6-11]|uniref:hypothetical protein n=1 Tax=Mucilaginibacter sp. UR6-11 TaxID=1435644 RepID=UPI001E3E9F74|nr:hypothetical protein [Mucilaginibacter sp. UR6-11]MCC8424341.1 hypothetical protein [Mucilaginibacter sp. UR6-11]
MKNHACLTGFVALVLSANLISCKADKNIQPTSQGNINVETLKTYLSRTLGVSNDEIDVNQQNFTVRGHSLTIKDVENQYATANEYKIKYGITKINQ